MPLLLFPHTINIPLSCSYMSEDGYGARRGVAVLLTTGLSHAVNTEDMNILLLENISQGAVSMLTDQGYHVDFQKSAWTEDELIAKAGKYHAIGIRSKTRITQKVLDACVKVSLYHWLHRVILNSKQVDFWH